MVKSRIAAAMWPWGTQTKEQLEIAAKEISSIGYAGFECVKATIHAYNFDVNAFKEVLEKYNLKPISFYFCLPEKGLENELYATLDKELEFIAKLGVDKICLQATRGRPEKMDEESLNYELNAIKKFAEKSREFGITSNLHNHYNTWVMFKNEIDNIFNNLDSKTIQFAPDTAHLAVCGCDPVKVIKEYANRINFTHFKDIKKMQTEKECFTKPLNEVYSTFCELGTGIIDFKSIFDVLKSVNYNGPLCEEFDKATVSNLESATINYNYILKNY